MRIRFKIYHETNPSTVGISIQCTPADLINLSGDISTISEDDLQPVTAELLNAIDIMAGKKDFESKKEKSDGSSNNKRSK